MTAGQGMVRDTSINILALVFSLVGGIAYQSILAWQLGPTGRGEYGIWIAIATITAVVFTLGSDRAVQVYLISKRITVSQAVSILMLVGLLGSTFGMFVLWLAIRAGLLSVADLSLRSQFFALLMIPAIAVPLSLQLLLAGLRHFVAIATISILRAILQIGLAVLFFLKLGWGIEAAYSTFVLSSALTVAVTLVYLNRQHGLRLAMPPLSKVMEMAWYSFRYLPARLGNVLNAHLVLLILAFLTTKHAIGLFSLAVSLMGQSFVVSNAMSRAIQPRLGDKADENSHFISQCCRISVVLFGVMTLGLLAIAGFVVPVLFSSSFQGSVSLLWFLAPGIWLKGAAKPLRAYFIGSHRPGMVSTAMLCELAVTVLAILVLYPLAGITGATISASLGYLVNALVLAIAYRHYSGRSFRETWLWSRTDTQCLKDHFIATFGISMKRRIFHSAAAAAKCPPEQIPRQVIFTPLRVIKKQEKQLAQTELKRTRAIAEVGRTTGLFTVPEILDFDKKTGAIEFERRFGLKPLSKILNQEPSSLFLMERLGQSLAAIHERLAIPTGEQILLPEVWSPHPGWPPVGLHGDFTAQNVLYCAKSDELVIIDCATSDQCGGKANIGPWCFDAVWLVRSLLYCPRPGKTPIESTAKIASTFVEAYCAYRQSALSTHQFHQYFVAVKEQFYEENRTTSKSRIERSRKNNLARESVDQLAQLLLVTSETQRPFCHALANASNNTDPRAAKGLTGTFETFLGADYDDPKASCQQMPRSA